MVAFAIDGAPVDSNEIDPIFFNCSGASGGSTVSATAGAIGLFPGDHVVSAALASSTPATLAFTVPPDFEGPSATGAGRLRLIVTDPLYHETFGHCSTATAATGRLGDAGFPATAPPGFDLPYGLVHFDAGGCIWGPAYLPGSNPPQVQRVTLGADRPLSPSTTAWEYGPTSSNSQPHWHALRTTVSGNFAVFEVTAGPGTVVTTEQGALHGMLDSTVALVVPRRGEAPPNVQDLWWVGPAENGWGMSITQHGDALFGAIFVYDAQGNPTWLVMPGGAWNSDYTVYSGNLYRPHGAPYTAYNAAAFAAGAPVGRASLTFDSDSAFTLGYTVDWVTGSKRLERQPFGPVAPYAIPPLADLWWGGESQNGWGFALAQQYRSFFGVLFTYDANGNPTWFVAPSGKPVIPWQYYTGMALYQTRGSPWLGKSYDPGKLEVTQVGSIIFEPDDAWNSAVLSLTVGGGTINKAIVRQPF